MTPKVVVFPPIIPVSGFLLGVVLEQVAHVPPWGGWLRVFGILLFALGAAGFAWMVVTMKRAGTPIHSASTPTALVEHGPFRWTRNPMYLFGATAYAGAAVYLVHPWSLALLPLVLVATHVGVVLREEAQLEERFGEPYRRYRSRVRRWL